MRRLVCDEGGQGMTEYSLLLALIGAAVLVAVFALGGSINNLHSKYAHTIKDALTGGT